MKEMNEVTQYDMLVIDEVLKNEFFDVLTILNSMNSLLQLYHRHRIKFFFLGDPYQAGLFNHNPRGRSYPVKKTCFLLDRLPLEATQFSIDETPDQIWLWMSLIVPFEVSSKFQMLCRTDPLMHAWKPNWREVIKSLKRVLFIERLRSFE